MGTHRLGHDQDQGAGVGRRGERLRGRLDRRVGLQLTHLRAFEPVAWQLRTHRLSTADHTLVMGVVNVTPDSFSDGGDQVDPQRAVEHGMALLDAGADIVDVGGESTRPGADHVPDEEELSRVLPVVSELASAGAVVSIDTSKPSVASAAIAAGAEIVNDVTGLAAEGMTEVCAEAGVGVVVVHMQGTPRTMQDDPRYDDVVAEVTAFLEERVAALGGAGIAPERVAVDPGIGFGKRFEHNLALIAGLAAVAGTGRPVVIGTSRKGFLGEILSRAGRAAPARDRDMATAATVAFSIERGASVVRVHDVAGALQAARVADAIVRLSR